MVTEFSMDAKRESKAWQNSLTEVDDVKVDDMSPGKIGHIKELKEMTYEDIMEADLSSDDEVLQRIEPGNKKKYNLSSHVSKELKEGHFKREHLADDDEAYMNCEA